MLLTGAPQSKSELSVFCVDGPHKSSDVSVCALSILSVQVKIIKYYLFILLLGL